MNELDLGFGVGSSPSGGCGVRLVCPFAFEGMNPVVHIDFDTVDLLLVVGAPEIVRYRLAAIGEPAAAFVDKEVFPQCAAVGSQVEGLKLVDDRVSDSVVHEIVALTLADFLAKVPGESVHAEEDKAFL